MKLDCHCVAAWAKLAWVATFPPGAAAVTVHHGPCVETREGWCAEAVWAGDFSRGDFDRTDLVFGSGVRCREGGVVFVSAGTTLDRLWYVRHNGAWYVSNSLPALLAVSGLALRDDYGRYAEDMESIGLGLAGYEREIPTNACPVRLVYFNNLVFDGEGLVEVEKPDTAPCFGTFGDYREFLSRTAEGLAGNLNDPARRHPVVPVATVSSGYDASVAAVIAREAGCRRTVTIRRATSLWRGSDSGEEVARHLELACTTSDRTARRYPFEEAIWAVAARPGVMNWTLFDYAEPLSLLFTGSYGDKVWGRRRLDISDPFELTYLSHGGIGEFRLLRGVFHCPVPFWGMRHFRELEAISFSEEMEPWVLHRAYDRPIARRIVEEAGVPREAFARRKKNTSHDAAFLWPYSAASLARFRAFLESRGIRAPSAAGVWLRRKLAWADNLVYHNVSVRLGFRNVGMKRRIASRGSDWLFQWANEELRKDYRAGFEGRGGGA